MTASAGSTCVTFAGTGWAMGNRVRSIAVALTSVLRVIMTSAAASTVPNISKLVFIVFHLDEARFKLTNKCYLTQILRSEVALLSASTAAAPVAWAAHDSPTKSLYLGSCGVTMTQSSQVRIGPAKI
jgi:hypothetical protein